MKKVSIIGTVGVPARYGGFESLVENIIGRNDINNIHYTIYCSSKAYQEKLYQYKGAQLKYVNLEANGLQSILYDIVSLFKASKHSDVIVILGVSGCIILPIYKLFFKKKLIINIDGLEHKRDKWNKWAKKFLKFSEKMAVRYADVVITDNKGITDYVTSEYGKESKLIAYGGDHVLQQTDTYKERETLNKYNLEKNDYAFSVCRIEPENNVHITLEAFKRSGKKLLFVGNWQKSIYGQKLFSDYSKYDNIMLLSPIYDLDTLFILRNCCSCYIHGHSAGGTNPSLVEAMFFKKPIFAFGVIYNKETTENKAIYYNSVEELEHILQKSLDNYSKCANDMYEIALRRYRWEVIAKEYESLY